MAKKNKKNEQKQKLSQAQIDAEAQKYKAFSFEECMPGYVSPHSAEIMDSNFFNKHFAVDSPFPLRRFDRGNQRYYGWFDEEIKGENGQMGDYRYFMSVTSFAGRYRTSLAGGYDGLLDWYADLGKAAGDTISFWASEFGTLCHIEANRAITEGGYDFGFNGLNCEAVVMDYLEARPRIPFNEVIHVWIEKFKKFMAAFCQFIEDKEVSPIATEFPIVSDRCGLGGCMDLVCELTFNKKRVIAIVDYKTGTNFYPEHNLQLQVYKMLWNEWFADHHEVTHCFNFAPNDFKGAEPKYKWKNQTETKLDVQGRILIAQNEGWVKNPKGIFQTSGKIEFGVNKIADCIKVTDYAGFHRHLQAENQ